MISRPPPRGLKISPNTVNSLLFKDRKRADIRETVPLNCCFLNLLSHMRVVSHWCWCWLPRMLSPAASKATSVSVAAVTMTTPLTAQAFGIHKNFGCHSDHTLPTIKGSSAASLWALRALVMCQLKEAPEPARAATLGTATGAGVHLHYSGRAWITLLKWENCFLPSLMWLSVQFCHGFGMPHSTLKRREFFPPLLGIRLGTIWVTDPMISELSFPLWVQELAIETSLWDLRSFLVDHLHP